MRICKAQIRRRSRRSGGAIIYLACGGITAMLGFTAIAVDYGSLVVSANRLQRAVDAAALAGAAQLKTGQDDATSETAATRAAIHVAAENGVVDKQDNHVFENNGTPDAIQFNFINAGNPQNSSMIRVTAKLDAPLYFARIFGFNSSDLTRTAVAQVQTSSQARVVPLGITQETYETYKPNTDAHDLTLVRANKEVFEFNDLVAFDLREPNSKSGPHFQQQLIGEDPEVAEIGQEETTLNSSLVSQEGNLVNGIATLFQRSAGEPWRDTWTGDVWQSTGIRLNDILEGKSPMTNPRVMNLIVTDKTTAPVPGTFNTIVRGFAPVYVEAINKTVVGEETLVHLRVRFLPPSSATEGTGSASNVPVSGVRNLRLIDPSASTLWR
jgi:hypothetical protein